LPGGPARAIAHGRRDGAQVALTFHASGDLGLADRLLAAARDADAPITVFAVGRWLDENPQMARRILDGGHELANHTYTHPALATLGREAVASEITRCRDVLARLTGTGTRWFRPSGVEHATPLILEEAGAAGYPVVVEFDVDPLDYDDPGPAAIEQRVRAGLQAGSIVSLHFGHAGTVEAFPQLVADARARGLTPVRVRELLS
jgi:peptidoglycan/xylan/chitin deacetylase (PgdA/CDA1 family)